MLEEWSEELQLTLVVITGLITAAGVFRCVAKSECVGTQDEDN